MKIIKYLTISFVLLIVISCSKHELIFNTEKLDNTYAEFQLHYFEPINNVASNYIDSVYVNNTLYSSVNGSGQLLPYNGVPGGATGRFFAVKSGKVNFKFYRKGVVVYDQDATLNAGKQNVFVHDLKAEPIVIDNQFPYKNSITGATVETWNTDSIASVMFVNLLYEKSATPYKGKLQYQYQDVRTKEWINLGEPVAFGEATKRVNVKIVKTVFNSSGYCRINYRILDETGQLLKVWNSSGRLVDYGDYWNAYIGRVYMHIFRGNRIARPNSAVSQWTSL